MKAKIKIEKEVEIKTLLVQAVVRYWEDATIDGVEDDGSLIPCREGDCWEPIIDIDSGIITNWKQGIAAKIHYKVCDAGEYSLCDEEGTVLLVKEGYVPRIMNPGGSGYGDYIIMTIAANGKIENWSPDITDFIEENED